MMISAIHYTESHKDIWNSLNKRSRNGHFLFDRDFMEYHRDRFEDASLLILRGDDPIALFPANRSGDVVYSHQGLSFGGLVLGDGAGTEIVMEILAKVRDHFSQLGIAKIIYKAIPYIYHVRPASEDLYALYRLGARLVRRDVSTAIDLESPGSMSSRRRRGIKNASRSGVVCGKSSQWPEYWHVLASVLRERHNTSPVHSTEEIQLLASRFPDNIHLFTALHGNEVVGGTVIFETPTVAHAQYIAVSPGGRDVGALDGLFAFVIEQYRGRKRFFDFGISTESNGQVLNSGLITQKEEFGGSGIVHDVYELQCS